MLVTVNRNLASNHVQKTFELRYFMSIKDLKKKKKINLIALGQLKYQPIKINCLFQFDTIHDDPTRKTKIV